MCITSHNQQQHTKQSKNKYQQIRTDLQESLETEQTVASVSYLNVFQSRRLNTWQAWLGTPVYGESLCTWDTHIGNSRGDTNTVIHFLYVRFCLPIAHRFQTAFTSFNHTAIMLCFSLEGQPWGGRPLASSLGKLSCTEFVWEVRGFRFVDQGRQQSLNKLTINT